MSKTVEVPREVAEQISTVLAMRGYPELVAALAAAPSTEGDAGWRDALEKIRDRLTSGNSVSTDRDIVLGIINKVLPQPVDAGSSGEGG